MNIPIKQIILEMATKLDKVANNYIKNGNPNKAFDLYGKNHVNQIVNLKMHPYFGDRHLMAAATKGFYTPNDNLSNETKSDLINVYKKSSRNYKREALKEFHLNNIKNPKNSSNIIEIPKFENTKEIPFNHGGGKHFLEGFLSNNKLYKGYSLEHDNTIKGIQVHPNPNNNSRASRSIHTYPKGALNLYGDVPAVLNGTINGNKLISAPVDEEAGIKRNDLKEFGKNLNIRPLEFAPKDVNYDNLSSYQANEIYDKIFNLNKLNKRFTYEDLKG